MKTAIFKSSIGARLHETLARVRCSSSAIRPVRAASRAVPLLLFAPILFALPLKSVSVEILVLASIAAPAPAVAYALLHVPRPALFIALLAIVSALGVSGVARLRPLRA